MTITKRYSLIIKGVAAQHVLEFQDSTAKVLFTVGKSNDIIYAQCPYCGLSQDIEEQTPTCQSCGGNILIEGVF